MLKYYHLPKKETNPQNKYHESKIICLQAVLLHGTRRAGKSWNGATFSSRDSDLQEPLSAQPPSIPKVQPSPLWS